MIKIEDKEMCCGCSACARRCPKQCIAMTEDSEGFLYPEVDKSLCVNCGLCEKVCPMLHPYDAKEAIETYAAINRNEEVRRLSSSGGIFHMLAEKIISQNGVVFGVRMSHSDWQAEMTYSETMEGVMDFMGSKYIQARTGTAYSDVEKFLKAGRKVMFTGTHCQVAGLNHFLGKDYDNLLTVGILCYGAPSPKVWRLYLNEVTSAARNLFDGKSNKVLRPKEMLNFSFRYDTSDEALVMRCPSGKNHYLMAFLHDLILRPACYNCKAKDGRSHSDLTIGDFWGIERFEPDMDDGKGTSVVVINTAKGRNILDWDKLRYRKSEYAKANMFNGGLSSIARKHPNRKIFFTQLDSAPSVIRLIDECTKPSFKIRAKMLIKRFLKRALHMFKREDMPQQPISRNILLAEKPFAITFRDKEQGWKGYGLTIRVKTRKANTAQ